MVLHKEVGEEACRTYWDKGCRRRAAPKEVGQSGQKYGSKVMCDNKRKSEEVRWIRGQDIGDVTRVHGGVDAVVKFCQESNGFFCAIATDTGWPMEEKVVPRVSRRDCRVV
jgi:hypothetical protein